MEFKALGPFYADERIRVGESKTLYKFIHILSFTRRGRVGLHQRVSDLLANSGQIFYCLLNMMRHLAYFMCYIVF